MAQHSGLDQSYLFRLESGGRENPSRDMVIKIALALVSGTTAVSIQDVDELLLAGDHAPLRVRGKSGRRERAEPAGSGDTTPPEDAPV